MAVETAPMPERMQPRIEMTDVPPALDLPMPGEPCQTPMGACVVVGYNAAAPGGFGYGADRYPLVAERLADGFQEVFAPGDVLTVSRCRAMIARVEGEGWLTQELARSRGHEQYRVDAEAAVESDCGRVVYGLNGMHRFQVQAGKIRLLAWSCLKDEHARLGALCAELGMQFE